MEVGLEYSTATVNIMNQWGISVNTVRQLTDMISVLWNNFLFFLLRVTEN